MLSLSILFLTLIPLGPLVSASKRGLPFNNIKYIRNFSSTASKINWAYNWYSIPNPAQGPFPDTMEYVPMLWGDAPSHTTIWAKNANLSLSRGSRHLLAFNEPDLCPNQACMTPQAAATAYKKHMMPFATKASLGAPACTNKDQKLTWLHQFLTACTGCKIDFIPIHWYDSATNAAYFRNYITSVHNMFGKPIWITEFKGAGTTDQQTAFLNTVIPWLDAQPFVERYAWFMADGTKPGIVDINGNVTPLGRVYAFS